MATGSVHGPRLDGAVQLALPHTVGHDRSFSGNIYPFDHTSHMPTGVVHTSVPTQLELSIPGNHPNVPFTTGYADLNSGAFVAAHPAPAPGSPVVVAGGKMLDGPRSVIPVDGVLQPTVFELQADRAKQCPVASQFGMPVDQLHAHLDNLKVRDMAADPLGSDLGKLFDTTGAAKGGKQLKSTALSALKAMQPSPQWVAAVKTAAPLAVGTRMLATVTLTPHDTSAMEQGAVTKADVPVCYTVAGTNAADSDSDSDDDKDDKSSSSGSDDDDEGGDRVAGIVPQKRRDCYDSMPELVPIDSTVTVAGWKSSKKKPAAAAASKRKSHDKKKKSSKKHDDGDDDEE